MSQGVDRPPSIPYTEQVNHQEVSSMTSFSDYKGWANLSKVRLNSQGIDNDGNQHVKGGMSLYKLSIKIDEETHSWFLRAYDREDAIFRAKHRLPYAKFRKVIKSN